MNDNWEEETPDETVERMVNGNAPMRASSVETMKKLKEIIGHDEVVVKLEKLMFQNKDFNEDLEKYQGKLDFDHPEENYQNTYNFLIDNKDHILDVIKSIMNDENEGAEDIIQILNQPDKFAELKDDVGIRIDRMIDLMKVPGDDVKLLSEFMDKKLLSEFMDKNRLSEFKDKIQKGGADPLAEALPWGWWLFKVLGAAIFMAVGSANVLTAPAAAGLLISLGIIILLREIVISLVGAAEINNYFYGTDENINLQSVKQTLEVLQCRIKMWKEEGAGSYNFLSASLKTLEADVVLFQKLLDSFNTGTKHIVIRDNGGEAKIKSKLHWYKANRQNMKSGNKIKCIEEIKIKNKLTDTQLRQENDAALLTYNDSRRTGGGSRKRRKKSKKGKKSRKYVKKSKRIVRNKKRKQQTRKRHSKKL